MEQAIHASGGVDPRVAAATGGLHRVEPGRPVVPQARYTSGVHRMPRRKSEDIDWSLWLQSLKPWMQETIRILAEAEKPLTTTEILERLADRLPDQELHQLAEGARAHNKLLHFLRRLHNHGILRRLRVGYYKKYAWQLDGKIKKSIMEALES